MKKFLLTVAAFASLVGAANAQEATNRQTAETGVVYTQQVGGHGRGARNDNFVGVGTEQSADVSARMPGRGRIGGYADSSQSAATGVVWTEQYGRNNRNDVDIYTEQKAKVAAGGGRYSSPMANSSQSAVTGAVITTQRGRDNDNRVAITTVQDATVTAGR